MRWNITFAFLRDLPGEGFFFSGIVPAKQVISLGLVSVV
jgi:hypothetical protein